tara:strand:- start:430 stop:975 length:546 start_codon:yes stop_codon:yes gene_type:complete
MENLKVNNLIKKLREKKYQFFILTNNQSKMLKNSKLRIVKYLRKEKRNCLDEKINSKNDQTLLRLIKIYKKKKLSLKDNHFIEKMYFKYNFNLNLKKKYNLKFKSLTKINTNILSYLYLGLILKPNRKINFIQILNTILKINDHLILNFKKNSSLDYKTKFYKLLLKEFKYINKLKRKISD